MTCFRCLGVHKCHICRHSKPFVTGKWSRPFYEWNSVVQRSNGTSAKIAPSEWRVWRGFLKGD